MSKILRGGVHKYSISQILRVVTAGMMILFAVTGCKTETDNVELTGITVTPPAKITYNVGEKLDTEGMAVTAIYSDETTKDVTAEATTAGYDETKAGEQTVIVSYTENEITQTAGFDVTVKAIEPEKETPKVELTKIEVTTEPAKKEYFVGAKELDLEGMVVTATYNDGTTKDVTADVKASGFDSSAATESQTITVTYGKKTATFTVKILAVEVTKIEITTQPTRKEYYVGSSALNLTGMVVTATYNNGATADVTKDITTSGFDSSKAVENQTITVSYAGKSATFIIKIVSSQPYSFHDTVTTLPTGTTGSYGTDEATYVEFGDWPQDVVPVDDVAVLGLETSKDKVTRGYMEFVQGLDGNYYVKCTENAYVSGYKYKKDDSDVKQGGTTSRWFKVMPIKWRVVDTAYEDASGSTKGKLLVAENILTANVPYYEDWENDRTIDGKTVYPNNYKYSQIRAYLNGYKYTGYDTTSSSNVEKTQWNSKGFLQTAFTSDAINKIITTKVDNSENSTTNYDTTNGTITKATTYACDPTDDKIFLLSEYEVTKNSKSTEAYDSYGKGNSRIRVTTDFAKANNAYQSTTNDYGGYWWLRSPYFYDSSYARKVDNDGDAYYSSNVLSTGSGVVPALSISF